MRLTLRFGCQFGGRAEVGFFSHPDEEVKLRFFAEIL
jgi:hypothetical protein